MKVLKDNYHTSNNKVSDSYPRFYVCEGCGSALQYEESDLRVGAYGCAYLDCPLCEYDNLLDGNEKSIDLTADNIEFPTHFWHISVDTGAIDCCNNEMVREYIYKAIDYFRNNKDSYDYGGYIAGNFYINVHRYESDEVYDVTVSNDFYTTEIPFETKDY